MCPSSNVSFPAKLRLLSSTAEQSDSLGSPQAKQDHSTFGSDRVFTLWNLEHGLWGLTVMCAYHICPSPVKSLLTWVSEESLLGRTC